MYFSHYSSISLSLSFFVVNQYFFGKQFQLLVEISALIFFELTFKVVYTMHPLKNKICIYLSYTL